MAFRLPNGWATGLEDPLVDITYQRPSDWPSMTASNREIKYLVSDNWPDYSLNMDIGGTASIIIDWGDGSTQSAVNGVTYSKTYTVGGGLTCSLGYTTYQIRIYGDGTPGTQITYSKIGGSRTQYLNLQSISAPCGVLEAYFGDDTITNLQKGLGIFENPWTNVSGIEYKELQFVRLPATMSGTTWAGAFTSCDKLEKVEFPRSAPNLVSVGSAFRGCGSIQEIVMPADSSEINTYSTFVRFCNSLKRIYLPDSMSKNTSLRQAFLASSNLEYLIFPPNPLVTDMAECFNSCFGMKYVSLPIVGTSSLDATSAFTTCRSLEYADFGQPSTTTATINMNNMFVNCTSLRTVNISDAWRPTTLQGAFQGCSALVQAKIPNDCSQLSLSPNALGQMFQNCFSLQKVNWPTTPRTASAISLPSTFQNCYRLTEFPNLSGWNISGMTNTFENCSRMAGFFTFSQTYASSLTNLASAFTNCFNLTGVHIFDGSTGITSLANTFQNCNMLRTVRLPNTLANCTTLASAFSGCLKIREIILPATMSSTNNFGSTFRWCEALETLTLPTSVANSCFWGEAFVGTINLESITLPTTLQSAQGVTSLTSMFGGGAGLPFGGSTNNYMSSGVKTITNLDRLGTQSSTATTYYDGTLIFRDCQRLTGTIDFNCKWSKFVCSGAATASAKKDLTSIRLRNAGAGQYAGTSPHIDIAFCGLTQSGLVTLFTDLPTITAKTIRITGNPGVGSLSAADEAIATGKGWTINKTT